MGHAQRELGGQAPSQASTPNEPVPANTSGQVPRKARSQSHVESRSLPPTRSSADSPNCGRDTHNHPCNRTSGAPLGPAPDGASLGRTFGRGSATRGPTSEPLRKSRQSAGAHQRTHALLDGADQPIIPHSVGRCTTTVTAWALVTRITMRGSVGMWTYMIRWSVPPALASKTLENWL
jgi:hypothetical protein